MSIYHIGLHAEISKFYHKIHTLSVLRGTLFYSLHLSSSLIRNGTTFFDVTLALLAQLVDCLALR